MRRSRTDKPSDADKRSVLGIDFGQARIGVAATDALGILAHPVTTIENTGIKAVLAALAAICAERTITRVVVGLPLHTDGTHGKAAKTAKRFAKKLAPLGVPVEMVDECFTTVEAEERLREAGVSHWRDRKQKIDQAAACLILETWLRG